MNNDLYTERVRRVDDATALKETDQLPLVLSVSGLPFFLSEDATFKDSMYDYPKANNALVDFYKDFGPDAFTNDFMISGKANELAGTSMIDWPGRPGTKVNDSSTFQVIEKELLLPEEYPEILRDYTGFMLRKYIPRAFPALSGVSSIDFVPSVILNTTALCGMYTDSALEAYDKLREIGKLDKEAESFSNNTIEALAEIGMPPYATGFGEVPYDILSDYFRGTMGTFCDLIERPEDIAAACDMFADIQISSFDYFKDSDMPVKRVFFPLHKGMDGFMNPEQFHELYWKPFKKVINALVDMGVTPIIYTEGPYESRLEELTDVPAGKVIYHFEAVDMERAKKVLSGKACISGNLSLYLLEYGTKQQVIDETKRLIDICAPGGGYIFDTNAFTENVRRENLEAMFETCRIYGKK